MARKPATAKKTTTKDASEKLFIEGSGNVFADIGVPDPEEALAKSHLAHCIREVVKARGLTQKAAAAIMGVDWPHLIELRLPMKAMNAATQQALRMRFREALI